MRTLYSLEIFALVALSFFFIALRRLAINRMMEILYTFFALFSLTGLVFVGIAALQAYGLPTGILSAVALLTIIAIIFEAVLVVIELLLSTKKVVSSG